MHVCRFVSQGLSRQIPIMLFYGFRVVKQAVLSSVSMPISTIYGKVCVFDRAYFASDIMN